MNALSKQLDTKYPNFENMDEELKKKIEMIRLNLLVFLSHDCRHLGHDGMFERIADRFWFGNGEKKIKWIASIVVHKEKSHAG